MSQASDHTYLTGARPEPEGQGEGKRMARRALIAAAGLGVVGIAAAETPAILKGASDLTQQEIQKAIAYGRQQLAEEIANLEGVAIDDAILVAQTVHNGVSSFVIPILSFVAGLTEITIDIAAGAVEKAQGFTQLLNIDIQALSFLDGVLKSWKANIAQIPNVARSLNDLELGNKTGNAEKYLAALKTKIQENAASTGNA